jgi:hypothetical protein
VNAESRTQLERRILAALCAGTVEGSVREAARTGLARYSWSDAAHQAVFEIVMSFPSMSADALREQLPARLTRRGFPDFDFTSIFRGSVRAAEEVEAWITQLNGPDS